MRQTRKGSSLLITYFHQVKGCICFCLISETSVREDSPLPSPHHHGNSQSLSNNPSGNSSRRNTVIGTTQRTSHPYYQQRTPGNLYYHHNLGGRADGYNPYYCPADVSPRSWYGLPSYNGIAYQRQSEPLYCELEGGPPPYSSTAYITPGDCEAYPSVTGRGHYNYSNSCTSSTRHSINHLLPDCSDLNLIYSSPTYCQQVGTVASSRLYQRQNISPEQQQLPAQHEQCISYPSYMFSPSCSSTGQKKRVSRRNSRVKEIAAVSCNNNNNLSSESEVEVKRGSARTSVHSRNVKVTGGGGGAVKVKVKEIGQQYFGDISETSGGDSDNQCKLSDSSHGNMSTQSTFGSSKVPTDVSSFESNIYNGACSSAEDCVQDLLDSVGINYDTEDTACDNGVHERDLRDKDNCKGSDNFQLAKTEDLSARVNGQSHYFSNLSSIGSETGHTDTQCSVPAMELLTKGLLLEKLRRKSGLGFHTNSSTAMDTSHLKLLADVEGTNSCNNNFIPSSSVSLSRFTPAISQPQAIHGNSSSPASLQPLNQHASAISATPTTAMSLGLSSSDLEPSAVINSCSPDLASNNNCTPGGGGSSISVTNNITATTLATNNNNYTDATPTTTSSADAMITTNASQITRVAASTNSNPLGLFQGGVYHQSDCREPTNKQEYSSGIGGMAGLDIFRSSNENNLRGKSNYRTLDSINSCASVSLLTSSTQCHRSGVLNNVKNCAERAHDSPQLPPRSQGQSYCHQCHKLADRNSDNTFQPVIRGSDQSNRPYSTVDSNNKTTPDICGSNNSKKNCLKPAETPSHILCPQSDSDNSLLSLDTVGISPIVSDFPVSGGSGSDENQGSSLIMQVLPVDKTLHQSLSENTVHFNDDGDNDKSALCSGPHFQDLGHERVHYCSSPHCRYLKGGIIAGSFHRRCDPMEKFVTDVYPPNHRHSLQPTKSNSYTETLTSKSKTRNPIGRFSNPVNSKRLSGNCLQEYLRSKVETSHRHSMHVDNHRYNSKMRFYESTLKKLNRTSLPTGQASKSEEQVKNARKFSLNDGSSVSSSVKPTYDVNIDIPLYYPCYCDSCQAKPSEDPSNAFPPTADSDISPDNTKVKPERMDQYHHKSTVKSMTNKAPVRKSASDNRVSSLALYSDDTAPRTLHNHTSTSPGLITFTSPSARENKHREKLSCYNAETHAKLCRDLSKILDPARDGDKDSSTIKSVSKPGVSAFVPYVKPQTSAGEEPKSSMVIFSDGKKASENQIHCTL